MTYKRKISEIDCVHNSTLKNVVQEYDIKVAQKDKEWQETYDSTIKQLEEKISKFEHDYIPIEKHEKIMNHELESMHNYHQQELTETCNQVSTQTELRMQEQINSIKQDKEKIENYAKQLKSFNDQLRGQLEKKSSGLMNSIRMSPK